MTKKTKRVFLLTAVAGVLFASVAAAMLRFMPVPRAPSDYIVAGSVATLVALLVPFWELRR